MSEMLDVYAAEKMERQYRDAAATEELMKLGYVWERQSWIAREPGFPPHVLAEQRAALLEALQWYVENDDTNIDQPGNEFWELGLERGRAAIALAQGDAA